MQNHLEIALKIKFWTRSVRNWTKTLTSVMSGPTLHSINEAGETSGGSGGILEGGAQSQPLRICIRTL